MNIMDKIRCAVVGVGYLGQFHAQKYQLIPNAELVGVCDVDPKALDTVSHKLNVPSYLNYRDLSDQIDAVSIASTSSSHFDIAQFFLEQGIHVLIEKPMTQTISQARTLIQLAKKNNAKLQVGHLERFNSAYLAMEEHIDTPLLIEAERFAPFKARGADVNVVFDLMIHDIDLIQHMVQSPIVSILAQGTPVLTKAIDIANARITFANHCVANLTASRISSKIERKTRVSQSETFLSIDYQNKSLTVFKKGTGEMFPGIPEIIQEQKEFANGDALLEEIKAFIKCIEENSTPIVTGDDGLYALETADKITSLIHANLIERHAKI